MSLENVVELKHRLSVTEENLKATRLELSKWKLHVASEVDDVSGDGKLGLKITCTKPNGQGFFILVSNEEIDFYINDQDALVRNIMEKIYDVLYKDNIRNLVSPLVANGIRNIKAIEGKAR